MKSFLERNKIYFETLGALLPSILAVLISVGALYISVDGRNLARQQAEMAQKLNRPLLTVKLNPVMTDDFKLISSSLSIENQGALVRDPKMNVMDFLVVECGKSGKGVWDVTLPVKNYFKYSYLTGKSTGEIAQLVPEKNFDHFFKLYNEERFGRKVTVGTEYAVPSIQSLVTVTYETTYGEEEIAYFLVSPNSGGERITVQEAGKWVKAWSSQNDPEFNVAWFDSIKVSDLREACGYNP